MENTNNKVLIDDETENYWQTQALLVMKNLDINEKKIYFSKIFVKRKNYK